MIARKQSQECFTLHKIYIDIITKTCKVRRKTDRKTNRLKDSQAGTPTHIHACARMPYFTLNLYLHTPTSLRSEKWMLNPRLTLNKMCMSFWIPRQWNKQTDRQTNRHTHPRIYTHVTYVLVYVNSIFTRPI